MSTNHIDPDTLRAELIGYQIQRESIEGKITEIQNQLGHQTPAQSTPTARKVDGGKRTMSAAARKRIAAAQRKRWAAYNKAKAAK